MTIMIMRRPSFASVHRFVAENTHFILGGVCGGYLGNRYIWFKYGTDYGNLPNSRNIPTSLFIAPTAIGVVAGAALFPLSIGVTGLGLVLVACEKYDHWSEQELEKANKRKPKE